MTDSPIINSDPGISYLAASLDARVERLEDGAHTIRRAINMLVQATAGMPIHDAGESMRAARAPAEQTLTVPQAAALMVRNPETVVDLLLQWALTADTAADRLAYLHEAREWRKG